MKRARTTAGPRQFAVTVQYNRDLDLIFVDANTIAEARDQAQLKYGNARIVCARNYHKDMSESLFDPHGVLARERETQRERPALAPGERRKLEAQSAVVRLVSDTARELRATAESYRRASAEVPDFGGPYQRKAQRLEAVANAYEDAAKRVDALLAKLSK